MPNNVVREQQLQSVASAAQSFSLNTQDNTLGIVIEALQIAGGTTSTIKTVPTLTIKSALSNDKIAVTYDGDGSLTAFIWDTQNDVLARFTSPAFETKDGEPVYTFGIGGYTATNVIVCATETQNFTSASAEAAVTG